MQGGDVPPCKGRRGPGSTGHSGSAEEVPVLQAERTTSPPRIDGRLDDAVWRQAPAAADFLQREPVEGAPPSERTEVRVLFDDDHAGRDLRR